jgi:hypothetical protein
VSGESSTIREKDAVAVVAIDTDRLEGVPLESDLVREKGEWRIEALASP